VGQPVILVVEDEPIILDMLCDFLNQMGYETVAAHDLPSAIAAARTTVFDAAVMDINLSGVTVFPAVDAVAAAGTPVIFASAYYGIDPPENYSHIPLLRKPISLDELLAWLAAAAPPMPRTGRLGIL